MELVMRSQEVAQAMIRHRPKLDFVDWAPKFIENPDGSSFRFRETQIQPARDLFNPKLTGVVIRAFSGAGKTYLFSAAMCYAVEQLRTAIGVCFPNKDLAEDWVNEELVKMFEATPALNDSPMVTDLKRLKRWLNGAELHALGANSSGRMRRLQASVLYADEIDAIEQDSSDEGDKLDQFFKRGRGRKEQFKWSSSYPSLKGASKVDTKYNQSDKCNWFVTCIKCETPFIGHTKQIIWTPKKPETARLVCPNCKRKLTDEQRLEMAKTGKYLDRHKEKPKSEGARGFHLNCVAHVGDHDSAYAGYLHEIAAEIERNKTAENPEKSRRVFVNTMDAESYCEPTETKPESETLYDLQEAYKPKEMLPDGVLVLTMGVDVQKGRLEAVVYGWGIDAQCWGITYQIILGSPLSPGTWKKLDDLIAKTYNHPSGTKLKVVKTLVDSGKWQDTVFEYTRPRLRMGVFACKGAKAIDRPLMDGKPTRIGRPVTVQYHVGTHEAKDLIYQRLELKPGDKGTFPRGYMHFPKNEEFSEHAGGDATGFFEMILAEDSKMRRSTQTGEMVRFFECPAGQRNEALDCTVYALAAERILHPQYEKIVRKMAESSV